MQHQAKLISCPNLEGPPLQFIILNNQELGVGSFGTVKKAYEQSQQFYELAVKIIPHNGDQNDKQSINNEVQILKNIPDHPNLVKVYPLKCWSEKNFYIFMEYCNEGTLLQKMKAKFQKKQNFSEQQIFKTFNQVLCGYEVLWKKKILHQDLKPQNILIKDGVCKITDFGFSIFHEGVKLSQKRQGTLEYMPLQKLTRLNYFADTKSDLYSLGVIFYKMITANHPYVTRPYYNQIDYVDQLKLGVLRPHTFLKGKMSLPMQHLFDLVLKMVAKKDSQRIDFDEVYKFMEQEASFLSFAQSLKCQKNVILSEQIQIVENKKFKFVDYSKAFAIPFSISTSQQKTFEELLRNQNFQDQEKLKIEVTEQIDKYLCSMRLMVYFFDRLARKLTVQKIKNNSALQTVKKNKKVEKKSLQSELDIQDRSIICLFYLSTKLTVQTINDSKMSRVFNSYEWKIYKSTNPLILDLIKKDEDYLKTLTSELILEMQQNKIFQAQQIIEKSKKPLLEFMVEEVRVNLIQLLKNRATWISLTDRRVWTTLNYILTAIEIIDNFNQRQKQWHELEGFFRHIQEQQLNQLCVKVTKDLKRLDISYSLAEDDWIQEQ